MKHHILLDRFSKFMYDQRYDDYDPMSIDDIDSLVKYLEGYKEGWSKSEK